MNGYKKCNTERLNSGVKGFEEIANSGEGSFQLGEQVLLIGPSTSGKFLFGTQFLAAASNDEKSLYISFVKRFDVIKTRMESLIAENDEKIYGCLHFNTSDMIVEEMLGALHNLLEENQKKYCITRVFIDGISALRCIYDSDEKYESFLRSFLRLLRKFPYTVSLLSFYTPRVFSSYAEIDIPAWDRFSTVIGFNIQEQFNSLKEGIVILKSLNPEIEKSLKVPDIKKGIYSIDLLAGWSKVGLLGGAREQVKEEAPFVKLFFENKSEEEIIKPFFSHFASRYPQRHNFRMVGKPNPLPTHWSFLGYAGVGHSNTKLLELRKYVMDVLAETGVLMEVPNEYIDKIAVEQYKENFLWKDTTASKDRPHVMIPFYADIGVFVSQRFDMAKKMQIPELEFLDSEFTWEDIVYRKKELCKFIKTKDEIKHFFIIPNTVTDVKNFISFFFELCWTYGWKFPNDSMKIDKENILFELKQWLTSDGYFDQAIHFLFDLIDEDLIPTPIKGGLYHESLFSRRWFSKIHLLPDDAKARADSGRDPLPFSISPLPGKKSTGDTKKPGISNVDIYSLGMIRQALTPETGWMLVSSLLESDVDNRRTRGKRGLPISRKMFRTKLIQDHLALPPLSVKGDDDFNTFHDTIFKGYPKTINEILGMSSNKEKKFRRTCDIPRFFYIEEVLARKFPIIFENSGKNLKHIKLDIISEFEKLFAK